MDHTETVTNFARENYPKTQKDDPGSLDAISLILGSKFSSHVGAEGHRHPVNRSRQIYFGGGPNGSGPDQSQILNGCLTATLQETS